MLSLRTRHSQTPTAPGDGAGPLPPAWGWKVPDAGRAAQVAPSLEYQATTSQLCGLYPFVAGSGAPAAGTPVGRHQLWGEVVCLDPLAWLRAGLVTNPGMFVLGQPGTGKSALVKRLVVGAVASGTKVLVLGDTKPDFRGTMKHLNAVTASAEEKLPGILDHVDGVMMKVGTTIDNTKTTLEDIKSTAGNLKDMTASARSVVLNNRGKFDGIIGSLKTTSDNLKGASAEIRRSPWRS